MASPETTMTRRNKCHVIGSTGWYQLRKHQEQPARGPLTVPHLKTRIAHVWDPAHKRANVCLDHAASPRAEPPLASGASLPPEGRGCARRRAPASAEHQHKAVHFTQEQWQLADGRVRNSQTSVLRTQLPRFVGPSLRPRVDFQSDELAAVSAERRERGFVHRTALGWGAGLTLTAVLGFL